MPTDSLSRRTLLRGAAGLGLASAAGTLLLACSLDDDDQAASQAVGTQPGEEPPPETTRIRLANIFPSSCTAALALAEPFLREEGFTDVSYVKLPMGACVDALATGEIAFHLGYAATHLRGLKGKRIGIVSPTGPDGIFLAMTLANVGIDVRKVVTVVSYEASEGAALLSSGRLDGLAAFPPYSQDLRARGIGTAVVNSMVDRPWSNYFCFTAAVNRNWMEPHPVATRRALRAVPRGADVIAAQHGHPAHVLVEGGFTDSQKYASENLREIPYDVWRRFDPADTVRYLTLRMYEAGLITRTPEQMISRGTDFSRLAAITRELAGAQQ